MEKETVQTLKNIVEMRVLRGFSQEYFAERLQMSQGGYSLIERGKRSLDYDLLCRIAQILECSVVDIIIYPKRYEEETAAKCRCNECLQKDKIIDSLTDYIQVLKKSVHDNM